MANETRATVSSILPGIRVMLNVGLMGGERTRSTLLPARRVTIMGAMLRELMVPGYAAEVQLHPGQEPTLVVTGMFNAGAPLSLLAWDACVLAEQDCIAIYYPDGFDGLSDGNGLLFGPHAEHCGEFNSEYFLLPMVRP